MSEFGNWLIIISIAVEFTVMFRNITLNCKSFIIIDIIVGRKAANY